MMALSFLDISFFQSIIDPTYDHALLKYFLCTLVPETSIVLRFKVVPDLATLYSKPYYILVQKPISPEIQFIIIWPGR